MAPARLIIQALHFDDVLELFGCRPRLVVVVDDIDAFRPPIESPFFPVEYGIVAKIKRHGWVTRFARNAWVTTRIVGEKIVVIRSMLTSQ